MGDEDVSKKKRLNFKYFASKTTGQGFQAFSFSFSLKIFSLGKNVS